MFTIATFKTRQEGIQISMPLNPISLAEIGNRRQLNGAEGCERELSGSNQRVPATALRTVFRERANATKGGGSGRWVSTHLATADVGSSRVCKLPRVVLET